MPSQKKENDAPDRREFLHISPAVLAAALTMNNLHAQSVESKAKAEKGQPATDIGPENRTLSDINPNSFTPPPTDNGEVATFWNSFSLSHRRIQEGGWTRQVNIASFPISKEMAGVNMRLTAGGIRELHWHAAAEWAMMLSGNARITAIDGEGRSFVKDVTKNDLWYFPEGIPHSIQGLEPEGCEFLLVFNDGHFSEDETTLISDWLRHTPPEVIAKNWSVPESELASIPKLPERGHYIFQMPVPPPLEQDQRAAAGSKEPSPIAYDFAMSKMPPTKKTKSGEVRVVDSTVFPASAKIAAAHVVVKPGGMRELHWHQNSVEWQYWIEGKGRMTVFVNASKARTIDFAPGDVGFVPATMGHYIENSGDTDLVFLEVFVTNRYQDLSLSDWVRHTPPELIRQHLRISEETLKAIPQEKLIVVPG